MKAFAVDLLQVKIFENNILMGQAAATFVVQQLNRAIAAKRFANLILATGASQFTFLDALKKETTLDWSKITVFHLDEYLGVSDQHPASFRKYLAERILDHVHPKKVYYLHGDAPDIDSVIKEYEELLKTHPVDVACIGIGENGHIAFNDPPVADFDDPYLVKVVELDKECRKQQLGEGWFPALKDVPTHALSLTIPAIMQCQTISCVVPDQRKAGAVSKALYGDITTQCPASVLRKHPDTVLFLDKESAGMIT